MFSNIGPVQRVRINYDRAGRSEGTATVTYQYLEDARQAIREFDGANAKGQPIRLTLLPGGGRGGAGGPRAEKSKSLFDRIERPLADRTERSLSPDGEGATGGGRRRRGGRGGRSGRSDTSKPAPDHIDRYVPGQSQRSPTRRGQTGRRPGERREDRRGGARDGRRGANGGTGPRPKKTQEELDAEMDDYWGNTTAAEGGAVENAGAAPATVTAGEPAGAAPAGNDDDIDMIE